MAIPKAGVHCSGLLPVFSCLCAPWDYLLEHDRVVDIHIWNALLGPAVVLQTTLQLWRFRTMVGDGLRLVHGALSTDELCDN